MSIKQTIGISTIVCFVAAVALFGWSLTDRSQAYFFSAIVRTCEKKIHVKQQLAKTIGNELAIRQRYPLADEAVSAFYFVGGKLRTWTANDIPVPENELAAIDTNEQFVKLGYNWYITKAYLKDSVKIVTAVLIKEGYSYENDFLQPKICEFLNTADLVDIVPPSETNVYTVFSENATPLFSLVINTSSINTYALLLHWIAIALFIMAIFFSVHYFS